jgi:hypothetical protein
MDSDSDMNLPQIVGFRLRKSLDEIYQSVNESKSSDDSKAITAVNIETSDTSTPSNIKTVSQVYETMSSCSSTNPINKNSRKNSSLLDKILLNDRRSFIHEENEDMFYKEPTGRNSQK